jgi:hypothetical protein
LLLGMRPGVSRLTTSKQGGGGWPQAAMLLRNSSMQTSTACRAQQALMLRAAQEVDKMKLPMSAGPGQDGPDQWDWPVGPEPDNKDGRQTLLLGMAACRESKPQHLAKTLTCARYSARR